MYFTRLLAVIVVVLGVSMPAFAASPLEKNQWRVELMPPGAPVPHFIDKVTFSDGNITSVIFERKNFPAVSYDTSAKGEGVIAWTAKQASETDGELSWQGELQGEAITGTLTWKQPDGKTTQYAMNGGPVPVEVPEGAAAEPGKDAGSGSPAAASASTTKSWWGCTLMPSK